MKNCKKIFELNGCILMIDYGYLKSNNQNTLQSVKRHKKMRYLKIWEKLILLHVNFNYLMNFLKENLKVKDSNTKRIFAENGNYGKG